MAIERAFAFTDLFQVVRAGSAWRFDATGALAEVAANQLRVDYDPATLAARGVLVEEGATNGIQNPRCEGAVVGAPGTRPTGWGFVGGPGIPQQIAGTGVEDGIPYVDVRYAGTSGGGPLQMNFATPGTSTPAAAAGQTWSAAFFLKLAAGSLTNVGTQALALSEWNGAAYRTGSFPASPLGSGALRSNRVQVARTLTDGLTNNVLLGWQATTSAGVAVDLTVRFGAPWLAQGLTVLSPSFPPPGTPGASTRAADDFAAIDIDRWLNPAAGTFVVDVMPGQAATPDLRGVLSLDDGTADNRIALRMLSGNTNARLSADIGGVQVAAADQATGAALLRHTIRMSYGPAGLLLSVNGAAPAGAASAVPAGLSRLLLGRGATAAQYLNGWLGPRLHYYPVQYTDTEAADGFTIRTR